MRAFVNFEVRVVEIGKTEMSSVAPVFQTREVRGDPVYLVAFGGLPRWGGIPTAYTLGIDRNARQQSLGKVIPQGDMV